MKTKLSVIMTYFSRLLSVLKLVGLFFAKYFGYIGLFILLCIQTPIIMVLAFPVLVLNGLFYISVFPIYYIVTGKKCSDKYCTPLDMYLDLVAEKRIYLKQNHPESNYKYPQGWYNAMKEKLDNIELKLGYND